MYSDRWHVARVFLPGGPLRPPSSPFHRDHRLGIPVPGRPHPPRRATRIVEQMDAPPPARLRNQRLPLALVTIAVVGMVATVGGGIRIENPATIADRGRLAVVDARGSLSTVDARGESVQDLAVPGVAFQFPAWSPDGARIAAVGTGQDGSGVYVFDADAPGTDPALLYESRDRPPFYLSWSPDGARVSFLTTESAGIALRVAPVDAAAEAEVVREGEPFYWDWVAPDRLLLHVGSGRGSFVGEVGLDGSTRETGVIESGLFRAPAVSAGAEYRAWVGPAAGAEQAVVVESRDGSGRHVVPVHGNVAFGFDSTATALAFISAQDATAAPTLLPLGPLQVVAADSGEVRILRDGPVLGFFWSPDGATIAALSLPDPATPDVEDAVALAVVDAALAAPPAVLAPGVRLHLAFIDAATGEIRSERHVRVTDTFVFQVLPYFDQYALSHRVWAADGSAIALPLASRDDGDQLAILSVDGSDPILVDSAVMGFWSP